MADIYGRALRSACRRFTEIPEPCEDGQRCEGTAYDPKTGYGFTYSISKAEPHWKKMRAYYEEHAVEIIRRELQSRSKQRNRGTDV